jgi:hypothetical protein
VIVRFSASKVAFDSGNLGCGISVTTVLLLSLLRLLQLSAQKSTQHCSGNDHRYFLRSSFLLTVYYLENTPRYQHVTSVIS